MIKIEARHALQKLAGRRAVTFTASRLTGRSRPRCFNKAAVKATVKADAQLNAVHEQMVQYRISDWTFVADA
ncbi:hypothetical protein CWS02_00505 [Enterobacter sp. EA-1]|nr:hypothetical protein CWS02_00505 [Enterobacter sp. EA-1]